MGGMLLDASIPSGLITEVTGLVTSAMSMFSSFPLNILLGIGIVAGSFKIFKSAKRAAK